MKHATNFIKTLLLCLLLPAACACNKHYEASYIAFDPVDVREAPSDDAKVVLKLSCGKKPGSYDKKTAEIPYAFLSLDKQDDPIGVRKIDESEKWGYVDDFAQAFVRVKGWIPLEEMICLGAGDETEKLPAFEVKGDDWNTLYRHPKEEFSDGVGTSLPKGELVQRITTSKDWSFVHSIGYTTTGLVADHYGWIKTRLLSKRDDLSVEEMKAPAYERLMERMGNQKDTLKLRNILYHIFRFLSLLALIFAVVFLIPALIHRRPTSALFVFPLFALYMFIFTEVWTSISLFYGLLMPMAAYTVLYPLLYIPGKWKFSFYPWALNVLSVIPALYVMGAIEFAKSPKLLGHIVTLIIYAVPVVLFAYFLGKLVYEDICPHCGYYGGHHNEGTQDDGTTVSESSEVEDVYQGTTTRRVGDTEIITQHYQRTPYTLVTSVHRYRIIRRCRKCDEIYYNYRSNVNRSKK